MTKMRIGGHLVDNMQKSIMKLGDNYFDTLNKQTQLQIQDANVSIDYINSRGDGIQLSAAMTRLLIAFSVLLYKKSETSNTKAANFYSGNSAFEQLSKVAFSTSNGNINLLAPALSISLYELTKEYYGGKVRGGNDVKVVLGLLQALANDPKKRALIRYEATEKEKDGKKVTYKIEAFEPLIKLAIATRTESIDGKQVNQHSEMLINLHPIFIHSISTKYVELPVHFISLLLAANGSGNVSSITLKLLVELYRASTNRKILKKIDGKPAYIIGQNNLFFKIAPNYINRSTMMPKKPKVIRQYLDRSIDIAIKMGIISDCIFSAGKSDDVMYNFILAN